MLSKLILSTAAISLVASCNCFAQTLQNKLTPYREMAGRMPDVTLDALYRSRCLRPCEHVGFSFAEGRAGLAEMKEHGANAVGSGAMWQPTQDPSAPFGVGCSSPFRLTGNKTIGQSFSVDREFIGVAVSTPTYTTKGSGLTLTLYRFAPKDDGATVAARRSVKDAPNEQRDFEGLVRTAQSVFTDVADNSWQRLDFDAQPPGDYYLELSHPTGRSIGVWAKEDYVYADGSVYLNRRRLESLNLQLKIVMADGSVRTTVPIGDPHIPLRLSKGLFADLEDLNMGAAYSVGNWNNGHFPYYEDWFYEKFPDIAMLDQNGNPLLAGAFGRRLPWPGIDHPAIVNGTARFISAVVNHLRNQQSVLYWVMGGEALYATYSFRGSWTDYQANAIKHFQEWLKLKYPTIESLNNAWRSNYPSFDKIEPPRNPGSDKPTLDWFDFRFHAMAERFQWHFDAARSADPSRFVMTCNHGTLYHDKQYAAMGADLELYASVSNGFEMGQIMEDADPDLYNLIYMETAGSLGKPLVPVRLAYKFSNPRARGGGTSYTPEAANRYFWESVGAGAWHLGFIQWSGSLPDGEWGVKGTPAQAEIKRLLLDWHRMEDYFDDAWPVKPKVAIYLSHPTWALDGFSQRWRDLHRYFVRSQIAKTYLFDGQLLHGKAKDYDVIISLDNRIIAKKATDALREYVTEGGALVCVGENGVLDAGLRDYGDRAGALWQSDAPFRRQRGIERRDRSIGEGNLVELRGKKLDGLFSAIEEILEKRAGKLISLDATNRETILETTSQETTSYHDLPQDMSGHRSLGQTITTTVELIHSLSICTPTYHQKVKEDTIKMEVRLGGPEGEKIAERTVQPDEITDNSWHEVILDRQAPVGTVYYLHIVPSENLPPGLIGVWSTSEDSYSGGQAYIDGKPVAGDRRVRMKGREKVPAESAIEAFVLSDGANAIVILNNISDANLDLSVTLGPTLFADGKSSYRLSDLAARSSSASGALGGCSPKKPTFNVSVAAHRGAAVFCERETGEQEAKEIVGLTSEAISALTTEAAATEYLLALGKRAWQYLKEGSSAKAFAAALRAIQQLGIRVSCKRAAAPTDSAYDFAVKTTEKIELDVEVLDLDGESVEGAVVDATLVPLFAFTQRLTETKPGRYHLSVLANELPRRYNYEARKYEPYTGSVEINLVAESDRRSGQTVVLGRITR